MAAVLPSLENLIDNYLQCCTAEGKSRKTIEWHETNLKRFTHFLKKEHPGSAVSDRPPEARRSILHLQNDVRRWETNPFINDTKGLSPPHDTWLCQSNKDILVLASGRRLHR